MTHKYACTGCDESFDCEVEYTPAVQGRLYGAPEDCYPDEPAQVDLIEPLGCPECNTPVDEDRLRVDFLEKLPEPDYETD